MELLNESHELFSGIVPSRTPSFAHSYLDCCQNAPSESENCPTKSAKYLVWHRTSRLHWQHIKNKIRLHVNVFMWDFGSYSKYYAHMQNNGMFIGVLFGQWGELRHYSDVPMSAIASQITGVSIACSTVCSGPLQAHRSPVDSTHKGQWGEKYFRLLTSSCRSFVLHCGLFTVTCYHVSFHSKLFL